MRVFGCAIIVVLLVMAMLGGVLWLENQAASAGTASIVGVRAGTADALFTLHVSQHQHLSLPLQSGCVGQACTGLDPINQGCVKDAETLQQLPILYHGVPLLLSSGQVMFDTMTVGLLEIRYSPSCQALWGRITALPTSTVFVTIDQQPTVEIMSTSSTSQAYVQAYSNMTADTGSHAVYGMLQTSTLVPVNATTTPGVASAMLSAA